MGYSLVKNTFGTSKKEVLSNIDIDIDIDTDDDKVVVQEKEMLMDSVIVPSVVRGLVVDLVEQPRLAEGCHGEDDLPVVLLESTG